MKVSRWMRDGFPSALLLFALAVAPAHAAGFGIFEQGSKATGMANAFTAQADDPSAMFYNVGGLAFFDQRQFQAGATFVFLGSSEFGGQPPLPPLPPLTVPPNGTQVDQVAIPIHFYWVEPISERVNFGLGLQNPFGLRTQWDDPPVWPGQFISVKADLQALDLNPNIGWQITEKFGIGAGVIVRGSTVELERHIDFLIPYPLGTETGSIGNLNLESDFETGFGFNLGLLHKVTPKISWGLSYRSSIRIDYSGDVSATQTSIECPPGQEAFCDGFDGMIAGLPVFGPTIPIETSIEFPDMASLGVAYRISPKVLIEGDFNWTGWSTFDRIDITTNGTPLPNSTIVADWDDANNYRFGLLWDVRGPGEWRFGAYLDETPQPDATVGPFLPDADQTGFSVGYGRPINNKTSIDLALMWINFADRTTTTNIDDFNGTYKNNVWLIGASIGF